MKKSIKHGLLITLIISAIIASASLAQASTLGLGSSGTEIRLLQSELLTLNYNIGTVDGIYGSKTMAAVEKFQRDNNLQADGIVGPQTQEALQKAGSSAPPPANY